MRIKKFCGLFLGLLLLFESAAVLAEEKSGSPDLIELKKILHVSSDQVPAPDATFHFTLASQEITGHVTDGSGNVIYSGLEGGLIFANQSGDLTFDPSMTPSGSSYAKSEMIEVNHAVFESAKPGVYAYTVGENPLPDLEAYEGISTDSTVYRILVYVTREDGAAKIPYVIVDNGQKKSPLVFENTYSTHDILLEKQVTGNAADTSRAFNFSVLITGAENEIYRAVLTHADGTSQTIELESGIRTAQIGLKNGSVLKISGLSKSDMFQIEEENYSKDGYDTSWIKNGGQIFYTNKVSSAQGEEDQNIVFTNDKILITPTGLLMENGPFLLIAACALIGLGYLGYRKFEEHRR